jgi:FkbM family methyltransferase
MTDIIAELKKNENKEINDLLGKLMVHDKPLIFFGAGFIGKTAYELFSNLGIKPDFFCDNNRKREGTLFLGIPVISFQTLREKYADSNILITTRMYFKEIRRQLNENNLHDIKELTWVEDKLYSFYGIKDLFYPTLLKRKSDVEKAYYSLNDELSQEIFYNVINYRNGKNNELISLKSNCAPYFEHNVINLSEEELFIDGGAYNGDTVEEFIKQVKGKYKKIYSFEPDNENYNELVKNVKDKKNVITMNCGLWDKKDIIKFQKGSTPEGNRFLDFNCGSTDVSVISIDEAIKEDIPTFIKMDVEGSELKALEGAKNTIVKHRPKLAICVYHKPLDIIDIPIYIKELVPEYKLYLRHYSDSYLDTILYAVP